MEPLILLLMVVFAVIMVVRSFSRTKRKIRLEEHGIDRHERTLATIYVQHGYGAEWMNVNERMVTLGHAWVMRRFYDHLPKDR